MEIGLITPWALRAANGRATALRRSAASCRAPWIWAISALLVLTSLTLQPVYAQDHHETYNRLVRWHKNEPYKPEDYAKDLDRHATDLAGSDMRRRAALLRANLGALRSEPSRLDEGFIDKAAPIGIDEDPTVRAVVLNLLARYKSQTDPIVFKSPRLEPYDFTGVAAIVRDGNVVCSGALIGQGSVLTSASCACSAGSVSGTGGTGGSEVVFGLKSDYEKRRPVTGRSVMGAMRCEAAGSPAADAGLAVLHFNANAKAGTGAGTNGDFVPLQRLAWPDAATLHDLRIAPARIAAPMMYLNSDISLAHLVRFAPAGSSGVQTKSHALVPITDKLCAATPGKACTEGRHMVVLEHFEPEKGCAGVDGSPAYVWAAPYFHLAAIAVGAVRRGGNCDGRHVYALIGPDVQRWLIGELGLDLVTCIGPNRCMIRQTTE